MRSNEPDVLGASVRQIFPMYPTLRPSTATMSANAMSESTMTGRVRLSGEALHSMKKGIRPEILSKVTVTCLSYATFNTLSKNSQVVFKEIKKYESNHQGELVS